MVTTNHYAGETTTFTESANAATVTSTLPAPGAGMSWRIDRITGFANAAFASWSIEVTENGGTSCFKVGATSALPPLPVVGPIGTKINDAPKVILTYAGGGPPTVVQLNVIATLVTSG